MKIYKRFVGIDLQKGGVYHGNVYDDFGGISNSLL